MAGKVRRVKLRVGEPGERTVESLPAISIIKISHQPKSDFIRTCLISAGGLIYLDVITQELADMGALHQVRALKRNVHSRAKSRWRR